MTQQDRLQLQVNHHINKEIGLLKYINDEIERVSDLIELTDSYSIQANWRFYIKALKRIKSKIGKLDRE